MGLTFEYDDSANVLRTRATGVISTSDLQKYVLGIIHNDAIRPGFIEVFSWEGIEDLLVSYSEILPFRDLWAEYLKKGCRATLVYAPTDLSFGIMRMFQAAIGAEEQNPDVPFTVVRSAEELEAALSRIQAPAD